MKIKLTIQEFNQLHRMIKEVVESGTLGDIENREVGTFNFSFEDEEGDGTNLLEIVIRKD